MTTVHVIDPRKSAEEDLRRFYTELIKDGIVNIEPWDGQIKITVSGPSHVETPTPVGIWIWDVESRPFGRIKLNRPASEIFIQFEDNEKQRKYKRELQEALFVEHALLMHVDIELNYIVLYLYSEQFKPVDAGTIVPEYVAHVTETGGEFFVKFEEENEE